MNALHAKDNSFLLKAYKKFSIIFYILTPVCSAFHSVHTLNLENIL